MSNFIEKAPETNVVNVHPLDPQQSEVPSPGPEVHSRYTVSADGNTVLDSKTGLTWDRFHLEEEMTWQEAVLAAEAANKSKRHGHTDWRVPTTVELSSLVDNNQPLGARIDQEAFPTCPEGIFWTCEPYELVPGYGRLVAFCFCFSNGTYMTEYLFVRLVRGG